MNTSQITTIGLDADDTLWHNERIFRFTQEQFSQLLADHCDKDRLDQKLLEIEKRNLEFYGFGIKGFTLSMIETAIEICDEEIPASTIKAILNAGRAMLHYQVDPLPDVLSTLAILAGRYELILITKGDLFDQERKLAASGLGDFFHGVEIVSNKTSQIYRDIFTRHGDGPSRALMVGNSILSDVLPALEAGAYGVHIPYEVTTPLEVGDPPDNHARYFELQTLAQLPALMEKINAH